MHHVLEIEEILRLIFEEVLNSEGGSSCSSAIALTTTCRTFSGIALDLIWSNMCSLAPLVMCLPAHTWQKTFLTAGILRGGAFPTLVLIKIPEIYEWTRFDFYASRIKDLRCRSRNAKAVPLGLPVVAPSVLRTLGVHRGNGGLLLPNLRILDWGYGTDTCPFLELCLGPCLNRLTSGIFTPKMVTSLQSASPMIQRLSVSEVEDSAPLSKAICGLKSLEQLRYTGHLSFEAILHIAALPRLRSLEMENDAGQILEALRMGPPRHYFPSLLQIHTTSDVVTCTALLDFVRPTTLRVLGINSSLNIPPAYAYDALFHLLSKTCPSLHTLFVRMRWSDSVIHSSPITPITLKPVLTFKNMVSLDITSPIVVTNATIGEMAAAWPKLESLALRNGRRTCGITLEGLVPLAKHCPCLHHLAIPVHASVTDNLSITAVDRQFVGPLALTNLRVSGSEVDDGISSSAVAKFLCHLFPNLADISSSAVGFEFVAGWLAVSLALKMSKLRSARPPADWMRT